MKVLAGVTVLSLAMPMMAQRVTPPAVPNPGPARTQPGIAIGASGGVGSPATGRLVPGNGNGVNVAGRPFFGPPPVYMTPDQLWPQYPEPLVIVPELFPSDPYMDLPPAPVVGQGRPGGLGVTITGGSASPPPVAPTPAPNATTAVTNAPVVTNLPPPNATNGSIPNTAPQLPPQ